MGQITPLLPVPRTKSERILFTTVIGVKTPLPYSTNFQKKQITGVIVFSSETSGGSRGLPYTCEGVLL